MRKTWKGCAFIFSIVLFAYWFGPIAEPFLEGITKFVSRTRTYSDSYRVTRVIDGDTIEIENGAMIRYIGINTPETKDPRREVECFGVEAYQFNKKLVEGMVVRLEKDISDTDKYGRLLRYVWIENQLINEELVKQGFASVATYPPDVKYYQRLIESQNFAKENQLGLWEKCKK